MSSLCLTELWIYPIKSLGGIRLKTAEVLAKGLKYDRRWMLIDEQQKFITQREHPKMALFKLSMTDDHLMVCLGKDEVKIPVNLSQPNKIQTMVWDDKVEVLPVNSNIDDWFSERLGIKCSLVHFPETHVRKVDQNYATENEEVGLADGFPFLIIGQSSLDDLNQKLEYPVPMNRFRPNFVFTGAKAFAEDHWKSIRIGAIEFKVVKPCARCVLTTVDQDSGIKSNEPLRTLSTYRKVNNKVLFGQNMIAINSGFIKMNDSIEIIA
jgi:uncharacterized protein